MNDILSTLNQPQIEAVTDFENPLLVLAGAGSGKTRVITSKVAYAIKERGYRPYSILAVTFTNKAAKEMRERVEGMCGDTKGLEMRTFHSFGAYLLRRYGERLGLPASFNIYDDEDSLSLLQSIYPNAKKTELRPYAKLISKAKDKGHDVDYPDFEYEESKCPDFRTRYRAYERKLEEVGCVDFADLIVKTNRLLVENPDVREQLQRRFRLILVDEYQDSNGSQFNLLSNLVGPNTQIVVVGDDDQSIYRFRGAEIENILSFPKNYPGTRVIKLEENYRSTPSILKIASAVIKNNKGRHEKTIFTRQPDGMKPELFGCLDSKDEALRVASVINRDKDYNNTCILYRTNAQSSEFETIFAGLKIPYQVIGALRFYDREEVKDMLALISFILNPRDVIAFRRMINKPTRGIGAQSQDKIIALSDHLMDAMEEAIETNVVSGKAKAGVESFLSYCKEANELIDKGLEQVEFANFLLKRFGIEEYYSAESDKQIKRTRLENLSAFVNSMSDVSPGREGLTNYLERITLDNTVLGNEDPRVKEGVKLMTIHTVKGLEFDRVFVTGLEEALMPGIDPVDEDVEEERRLFYVAVTRARRELYLTYSRSRQTFGQWNHQTPSRFLKEIPKEYYEGTLDKSDLGGYTNRFTFEPRVKNQEFSNRFVENKPSWAKGISLPPTKKSVKLIKSVDFKVGDRVVEPEKKEHGVIESVNVTAIGTKITVKYDSGKVSTYNAAFARLQMEEKEIEWNVGDRISVDGVGSGKVIEVRKSNNGTASLRVSFDRGGMGLYKASAASVHKL